LTLCINAPSQLRVIFDYKIVCKEVVIYQKRPFAKKIIYLPNIPQGKTDGLPMGDLVSNRPYIVKLCDIGRLKRYMKGVYEKIRNGVGFEPGKILSKFPHPI
jgi:hypothetical protein